jgi:thiamine transporter ThiT
MSQTLVLNKTTISNKALIATAAAVIASVALPQILHVAGVVSGSGPALGENLLPMQLPVLIAGLIAGPFVGVIAGILSPLLSSAISGMPGQAVLPYIMIELVGYGLAAGVLSKVKMPVFGKLLLAQVAGRILRTGAILIAVYGMGSHTLSLAGSWNYVVAGLPGIVLQWCLIPLIMVWIKNVKKDNE